MTTDMQLDVSTSRDIPRRNHSKQLVAAIATWDPMSVRQNHEVAGPTQELSMDILNNIIAEASFLGYPQTIKLARAIRCSLDRSSKSTSLDDVQSGSLSRSLSTLKERVNIPSQRDSSLISDLLKELQIAFSLTDSELTVPLDTEKRALPVELTAGKDGNQGFEEHRDLDVYRNSRLDSLDQCFEEESWIVSQLASLAEDLASGTHCSHPAARLMHVLKNHKLFNQVDRVCLVGRVAGANQLVVVDASLSDRCSENSLKKGYSCFVNPEGSLFKMRPGTVRMFGDSERVLSSFAAQGKPAQRSIALISDLGLRSGLCLALGRGSEVQGFLFLNSVQEDLFREISIHSAPILSLFGLIATITLDTSGFHPLPKNHPNRNDGIPKSSMAFEPEQFKAILGAALASRSRPGNQHSIAVNSIGKTSTFLYLPTTIVNSLAELIARVHNVSQKVIVNVEVANGLVSMGFDHGFTPADAQAWKWLTRIVHSMDVEFANKPVDIKLVDTQVLVEFPFEPILAGHQGLLYSTVY